MMIRVTRDFRSDNTHAASPEILEALTRANRGTMTSYGGDEITARVRERCREIFETDVEIFPVLTGTAGNALAIAAMTPPTGEVLCHEDAHIVRDERGAPEFFSGGARLIAVPGAKGKLPALLPKITTLSVTQATEAGTVYTPDELRELVGLKPDLHVHMDGARFANALAFLGCSAAEITWRAGVDILVLGGTKNGALPAELIVVFDRALASALEPRWHRAGHRVSKMRFLSAQLEAYLADDLWLRNARRANAAAARIAAGLANVPGIELVQPVEANVVFLRMAPEITARLKSEGFLFYEWPIFGDDVVRLVTAFSTADEDVDALVDAAGAAASR